MDHVAFHVGGVEAVEALKIRFEELGVTHSGLKSRTTGTAMNTLRDPDNTRSRFLAVRSTRPSPLGADPAGSMAAHDRRSLHSLCSPAALKEEPP